MEKVLIRSMVAAGIASLVYLLAAAAGGWLLSLLFHSVAQVLAATIALLVFIDKVPLARVSERLARSLLLPELKYPGNYEERSRARGKDIYRVRKVSSAVLALLLFGSAIAETFVTGGI